MTSCVFAGYADGENARGESGLRVDGDEFFSYTPQEPTALTQLMGREEDVITRGRVSGRCCRRATKFYMEQSYLRTA